SLFKLVDTFRPRYEQPNLAMNLLEVSSRPSQSSKETSVLHCSFSALCASCREPARENQPSRGAAVLDRLLGGKNSSPWTPCPSRSQIGGGGVGMAGIATASGTKEQQGDRATWSAVPTPEREGASESSCDQPSSEPFASRLFRPPRHSCQLRYTAE